MINSLGMELAKELTNRGLVEQTSADLDKILSKKRTVYVGVDPTADSLHIGHLVWVFLLKRLADAGHKVILLVGGGTGMIGDPKEQGERVLLDESVTDDNAESLKVQLSGLVGERADLVMVNNAKWLREVKFLPFLRDVGKHFTVNDLIKREVIKRRLETPDESISYTEFTYALLQAYDYWELHKRYGCDLQIGGSDQWTNILSGVDLIRKREGEEVFAFSFPLITDAAGKKFGKSEGNAVWLDSKKTSPFQFYQFWLNVEDEKVIDYLKIYTDLSLEEIDNLAESHKAEPGVRLAQRTLADAVTHFVHGEAAPAAAARVSEILFSAVGVRDLSVADRDLLLENAPTYKNTGDPKLVDVLVESGLVASKRQAREFIESGAVSLNGEKLTDVEANLSTSDLAVLRRGKRNAVLLLP